MGLVEPDTEVQGPHLHIHPFSSSGAKPQAYAPQMWTLFDLLASSWLYYQTAAFQAGKVVQY